MENENIKKEDYTVIKELIVNREKYINFFVSQFQNSIIDFCKNYNQFQSKRNFFDLTIKDQFDFNECIEFSANKIKNDFKDLENLYVECKENCFLQNNFRKKEFEDIIEKYNNSQFEFTRPALPPCINECKNLNIYLNEKYHKYMIIDSGIYTELINYKKYLI